MLACLAVSVSGCDDCAAYVCERGRCELPTSDPGIFARQLRRVTPVLESGPPPPLAVRGS